MHDITQKNLFCRI